MKRIANKCVALVGVATLAVSVSAGAQQAMNMDQLLRAVEQGRVQDNK